MPPQKYKIIFHVGYPRSASTYLQSLFEKQKKINYISKYNNKYLAKVIDFILIQDVNNIVKLKPELKKIINKIIFSKEKINVISDKSFLDFSINTKNSPYKILQKINLVFEKDKFDKKFLVIIRNQKELIISHYTKCFYNFILNKKKWSIFKNYINDLGNESVFDSYKFDKFLNFKKKTKINLVILPFEKLILNQKFFLKKIFDFMNITSPSITTKNIVNKSIKKRKVYLINKKNFLISNIKILNINNYNYKKKIGTLFKRLVLIFNKKKYEVTYKPDDIIRIKKFYFNSNKKLLDKKIIDKKTYYKFYL